MQIDPHTRLEKGLEAYFEAAGMARGYDQRWVRIQLGPIPFVFPNSPARVRAARLHDLHHVATSYATDLIGESEIGAWELASGCGHHWPAWTLNLGALAIGACLAPRRVFAAFVRGRRCQNLYRETREFDAALLDETVAGLRARLGLDRPVAPASRADRALFAGWLFLSLLYSLGGPVSLLLFYWGLYPIGLPSGRAHASARSRPLAA